MTTRSNCEELPPEYQPPDYPPLDFHTLFPESSDQQGNEEIHRKQIEDSTHPRMMWNLGNQLNKRWTKKLLCLITGGLIIIWIIWIISIQLNYKNSVLESKLNRIGQKLNRIERNQQLLKL